MLGCVGRGSGRGGDCLQPQTTTNTLNTTFMSEAAAASALESQHMDVASYLPQLDSVNFNSMLQFIPLWAKDGNGSGQEGGDQKSVTTDLLLVVIAFVGFYVMSSTFFLMCLDVCVSVRCMHARSRIHSRMRHCIRIYLPLHQPKN